MIQQETILKVQDNSGAKSVKCIKVLGGFKRKYAYLGDTIVVSVRQLRNKSKLMSKVKEGEIYRAVIIKTKKSFIRKDGIKLSFGKNVVTLLNKKGNPIATRIASQMPKQLRTKNNLRLFTISGGLGII